MKAFRVLLTILIILLFAAGIGFLLYPTVSDLWNRYRNSQLIGDYTDEVQTVSAQDLSAEWERAYAYNEALLPCVLPDSFAIAESAEVPDPEYMACLNIAGDEMMGYVEIPKINVKLPIYHTTSEEVLQKGAGHLMGSSLPVGGESTHAVIAAHRGLANEKMFTDLDKVEIGDHFLLHILDDTLYYEVDEIDVVNPQETEALSVVTGQDLVTLMTCTPYGVNTQRLLVRGHRVANEEEAAAAAENEGTRRAFGIPVWVWLLCGIVLTVVLVIIIYRVMNRELHPGSEYRQPGQPSG